MPKARDAQLRIPPPLEAFLRTTIASAGGNEVFFLGRVVWTEEADRRVATLEELDVLARGNDSAVPAVLERAERWDIAIHNHPGGDLRPSDADLSIASELASRSVGFAIISDDARRHYLVTAPFPQKAIESLDPEEVRAVFVPGGPLSEAHDGFEERPGQVEMALEVTRALNENRVLAAEGGTGVGKSFAYLVPAILWAARNGQRVVISTGTIHLQEQLVGKDLPFLRSVLPVPFRFALAKGRNNYACRRKVEELAGELQASTLPIELSPAESRERGLLESLVEWSRTSPDGSRADLSWIPPAEVWEQVMSETDKSLKVNCPHYAECFFYRAKRLASSANIVVANHHLFFADLSVRRETNNYTYDAVLPSYERVIFDEAHHLEDIASEHFGVRLSRSGFQLRLRKLLPARSGGRATIASVVRRLRGLGDGKAADSIERAFGESVPEVLARVDAALEDVDAELEAAARASPGGNSPPGDRDSTSSGGPSRGWGAGAAESGRLEGHDAETLQIRYRHGETLPGLWAQASRSLETIQSELAIVLKVNDRAQQSLSHSPLEPEKLRGVAQELNAVGSRIAALMDQVGLFRSFEDRSRARWITRKPSGRSRASATLEFGAAPIRVAEELKSGVYEPMRTVVLTSATLSVAGSIDFLADRLGLSLIPSGRFEFRQHDSPFDFRKQVLTAIPTDGASPESREYHRSLPEMVFRIVEATGGRAFVLFTSYSLLRRTYAALEARLTGLGLRPAAQGDLGRSELLERFRTARANVLFGTDSFWEGVDVRGRALECVILTRLPFRVPSEPLQEARLEDLQERGANPFAAFTVPQAVLKFKQGFGRLIRSSADRGIVAILDPRILSRSYGRIFLRSLPDVDVRRAPLGVLLEDVRAFFAREPAPPWESGPAPGRGGTTRGDDDGRPLGRARPEPGALRRPPW